MANDPRLSPEDRIRLSANPEGFPPRGSGVLPSSDADLQRARLLKLERQLAEARGQSMDAGRNAPQLREIMEGADLALAGPDAKQARLRSMGEDTIRRIKEQEAAARTQRDVDYEEGIQRGMERSAGSTADFIKRKELEEGGRPVGVAPAIKVRTPEGDFEEFTEGEALYDPRKWEPKFFIDSTGRPRRHMVKKQKRKGSVDESAHKPREAGEAVTSPTDPLLWSDFGADSSIPGYDTEVVTPGSGTSYWSDFWGDRFGREGEDGTSPGDESLGEDATSPGAGLSMDEVFDQTPLSTGEEAASGDTPQAVALQPSDDDQLVAEGKPFSMSQDPVVGEERNVDAEMDEWMDTEAGQEAADRLGSFFGDADPRDSRDADAIKGAIKGGLEGAGEEVADATPFRDPAGVAETREDVIRRLGGMPREFGDMGLVDEGPTEEQLKLREENAEKVSEKKDEARRLRMMRNPRYRKHNIQPGEFRYTRTGDAKADAAIAAAMVQAMSARDVGQIKAASDYQTNLMRAEATEQGVDERRRQLDLGMKYKMVDALTARLADPSLRYQDRVFIQRQLKVLMAELSGAKDPTGGEPDGAGVRVPPNEARQQLEQEDVELLTNLDVLTERINELVSSSPGAGVFGIGSMVTRNTIGILENELRSMVESGVINQRNVGAFGSVLASRLDSKVTQAMSSRSPEDQTFLRNLMNGVLPE